MGRRATPPAAPTPHHLRGRAKIAFALLRSAALAPIGEPSPHRVCAAGAPPPSSSGLGRRPLTPETGVRVPLGAPFPFPRFPHPFPQRTLRCRHVDGLAPFPPQPRLTSCVQERARYAKGMLRMLDRREARERLTIFLPVSLVRRLKATIPPGQRSEFISETLLRALEDAERAREKEEKRTAD